MVHGQIYKKPIFSLKQAIFFDVFLKYLVVNLSTKILENLVISKINVPKMLVPYHYFWLSKNGSRLKIQKT
jgi:hypothetical protein